MSKYRHIIWDWNGTLIDDVRICVEVLNAVLSRYNKPHVTLQQYLRDFDFPVIDYYRKLGFDFSKIPFEEVAQGYIALYKKKQFECSLQDGALDTIKYCAAAGLNQSILSAYNQKILEEVVRFFGLDGFFTRIVGLDDLYSACKVENGKRLLKELGLKASSVLLVGDTIHDFEVARQVGADCVLIDDGHQLREKLESTGATILDSIKDVPNMLGSA